MADTRECVAMPLRPGTTPPSDVTDHKAVLCLGVSTAPAAAVVEAAGTDRTARPGSHALLDHLQQLSPSRRRVRWVTGWAVNATVEQAIALLPAKGWTAALRQDGKVHEIKGLAATWFLARSPS
ncbi:hypothetical protein ACFZBP_10435 [Streptomyces sp. NPDC008086]|uniref:hypothetical protein n=1 Tax=Streptomyces sp. NPDC008086 TaxID=3364807 RepID=UPI0036EB23B2